MSSSTLTQKYALAYPFVTANTDHFQGEDLGRTDLQEDGLEFHNSSTTTSSHIQNHHLTNHRLCIAIRSFSPRQAPTKQLLLPPHRFINIQHPQLKQQALPLDALLLRPILRRRHRQRRHPLSKRPLPTHKLPRHPRRQPRSLRTRLDRNHRRRNPLPHGHYIRLPGRHRQEPFPLRFHAAVRRRGVDLWLYISAAAGAVGCVEVERLRGRESARVLGSVRVCEYHVDTGCVGQLESVDGAELCVCRCGVCGFCRVSLQESVSFQLFFVCA